MTKTQNNTCVDCVGKHRDYRSEYGHLAMDAKTGATILEPHNRRYIIKCDDCKQQVGSTDSLAESAAGGRCWTCKHTA